MVYPRKSRSGRRWSGRIGAVVALVLLLSVPSTVSAFPLWGDASVGTTYFQQAILIQGDDPSTTLIEPRGEVKMIHRTFWSIPWNSSQVYAYISPDARNVSLDHVVSLEHQGSAIFMPGDFSRTMNPEDPPSTGWKQGDDYEGYFYWTFPQSVSRDVDHSLVFNTNEDFEDADSDLTDMEEWNITDGTLSLASNVSSATYVSKRYTGGVDLTSVNMSVSADNGDNMTFQVSADNGTTWVEADPGTPVDMVGSGSEFRWKVTMTDGTVLNASQLLRKVDFHVMFTPLTTDIWLEAVYYMDMDDDKVTFDITFPFDITTSSFIFVGNVDADVTIEVDGASLSRSEKPSEGKYTYSHMGGDRGVLLTFTVKDVRQDEETTSIWLYVGILIPVLLMAIGISMVLLADRAKKDEGTEEAGTDPEDLETRKAQLLEAISDLDEDREIGIIDDEEHQAKRKALKDEAVEVMKQLEE